MYFKNPILTFLSLQLWVILFELVPERFQQGGHLTRGQIGIVIMQYGFDLSRVGLVVNAVFVVRLSVFHFDVVSQSPF